jgi:hypothetical protein
LLASFVNLYKICNLCSTHMFDDQKPQMNNKVSEPLKEEKEDSSQDSQVHTMPMEYYLGDKTVGATKGSKQAPASAGSPKPSGGKSKFGMIAIIVILVVLAIASIGLLVYTYMPSDDDNQIEPNMDQTPYDSEPPIVLDQDEPTEPDNSVPDDVIIPDENPDPTVVPDELPEDSFDYTYSNRFNINIMSSLDNDNDGLTDQEEFLIGTKATVMDSDGDGYADGSELSNFYSPTQSSIKLEESNFTAVYNNEMYGYNLLYPKNWLADSIDQEDTNDVMFTSNNNEFVNVFIENKSSGESVVDWYLRLNPKAIRTQLKYYNNNYTIPVVESVDGFTVFIAKQDMVVVINYSIGQKEEAFYPNMFKMMVDSFKFIEKSDIDLPTPDDLIGNPYSGDPSTNNSNLIDLPTPDDLAGNPYSGTACTEEAKICPDGSSVGRIAPDCEFAACP